MRNLMLLLFIVTLLVAPAIMPAATFWDGVKVPLGQFVGVVLMIFGVPVLTKLTRKWGVEITDAEANAAIDALINFLVNIDLDNPNADSKAKKAMAVISAENNLPAATKKLLEKRYGSLEAAVQVAFERSSLNNKTGVIPGAK